MDIVYIFAEQDIPIVMMAGISNPVRVAGESSEGWRNGKRKSLVFCRFESYSFHNYSINNLILKIMTAQEFYKQNKGKYFMYRERMVRVVGFDIDDDNSLPIMIAYKDGYWSFPYSISKDVEYVVDESLINDGDSGEWVSIESLIQIEEELNLCELLKGCEGITLYSPIFGDVILTSINLHLDYPIEVRVNYGTKSFSKNGLYLSIYNGECTLFPSKENRDWSTFVNQNKIKEGTPVMCKKDGIHGWSLRRYDGIISTNYNYVVPVSEFNFDDFEANKVGKYKQS